MIRSPASVSMTEWSARTSPVPSRWTELLGVNTQLPIDRRSTSEPARWWKFHAVSVVRHRRSVPNDFQLEHCAGAPLHLPGIAESLVSS